jgi:hypothetical protein
MTRDTYSSSPVEYFPDSQYNLDKLAAIYETQVHDYASEYTSANLIHTFADSVRIKSA